MAQGNSTGLLDGYGGGEKMPLSGYALLLGAYAGLMGGALWALTRGRHLPRENGLGDLALVGIATHKLTRTITRDWVTAPVRAPFTRFEETIRAGEVLEKSRGGPLRRAVGDLLTCPFCTGPWVAGGLLAGLAAWPRPTRFVAGIFAAVTVSDFLHRAYEAAAARSEELAKGDDGATSRSRVLQGSATT